MRIIRTTNKRGDFYTVDGVASCSSIEAAVELAIDSLAELIKATPVHNLWTVYA